MGFFFFFFACIEFKINIWGCKAHSSTQCFKDPSYFPTCGFTKLQDIIISCVVEALDFNQSERKSGHGGGPPLIPV